MKRKFKRKLWLDKRCQKLQKVKKRKNNKVKNKYNKKYKKEKNEDDYYITLVPKCFSFVENTEETIEYFIKILNRMKTKKQHRQTFYIDSSQVTTVTTDALVYILAILYNLKSNHLVKYDFKGNFPTNENAKNVYLESGFMNYVKSKKIAISTTADRVQILTGNKTDATVAARICDFVIERFKTDRKFTLDLYKTLIELMSNTCNHAYNKNKLTQPYWYVYAIDIGRSIQFAFIDTGAGIPNTVRKHLLENIPFYAKDSELIYSAFLGDSRTETKLSNRGHGLPFLYKKVQTQKLENFYVLSGKGCCKSIKQDNNIILNKTDYKQGIFGTIFQFEIKNQEDNI